VTQAGRSSRAPASLALLVLALALLTAACGGGSGGDGDDSGQDDAAVNAARELFASKGCAECHGADGEGTDSAPIALAGTRMIIQQFQTRVRNGRGSAMPAHTPEQISDDEIRVLYDWLREGR
jgi:mono/diheme cytochrome c family protein